MTPKKARTESTIDRPQKSGGFTLYPATFGLLEWLQSKRKNPVITGKGDPEMIHLAELCFAFTRPAREIASIPPPKLRELVDEFSIDLSTTDFVRIQKHAGSELMKFQQTAVVPKKKPEPKVVKEARKPSHAQPRSRSTSSGNATSTGKKPYSKFPRPSVIN